MQKIKILIIGKIKNKNLLSEIQNLSKRITRLEITELKEVKDKNPEIVKKKEFEIIKPYISNSYENILLTESGKEYSTFELTKQISKINKPIQFIISGPYGPSSELKDLVYNYLSLSKMIFTHEQALYMLIEQLYRVQCEEKGIKYTK